MIREMEGLLSVRLEPANVRVGLIELPKGISVQRVGVDSRGARFIVPMHRHEVDGFSVLVHKRDIWCEIDSEGQLVPTINRCCIKVLPEETTGLIVYRSEYALRSGLATKWRKGVVMWSLIPEIEGEEVIVKHESSFAMTIKPYDEDLPDTAKCLSAGEELRIYRGSTKEQIRDILSEVPIATS